MDKVFENAKCLILDMDGTVYLGNTLIEGSDRFLKEISKKGIDFKFFTNNSSHNAASCVNKLRRLGFDYDESKIIISSYVTIDFIKKNRAGKKVYLLGNDNLTGDFAKAGIPLTTDRDEADIVVLGFDTSITYKKIEDAAYIIARGKEYISTHPDVNCPTDYGFMPDNGSFISLFKTSTGREPDLIMGKPYSHTVDYVCSATGCSKDEIVFIGDRMETDIYIGVKNGVKTALVLSGVTSEESMKTYPFAPTVYAENLEALLKFF
ncbi:MAG: HAD-IIA family hydrolase [Clostridiales bacterium]|jgi:glycerol-1-phosphate dehydrogenase [NAD(P)+]|nr:HAD-IIA family hydrolase [Clostridiales bacterium]HOA33006.1 HAD-IIA family hydrolase [Clostridiales bacterium]HOJ35126.1 HAD-IIA family hydrolase [Clostridiales bacterium]HOL79785.1 HAD-IIA family hydrolase [Clostridiales bacterium]HPP67662.1 HAD-IIA family hydrolase [Clostridiales bacterium]